MTEDRHDEDCKGQNMSVRNNGNGSYDKFISLAAVILALGSLFWTIANPRDDIKEARQDLQGQINEINRSKLSVPEHQEFKEDINRRFGFLGDDVHRLEDGLVSRPEHVQHWETTAKAIGDLEAQIGDLQKQFTAGYGPGDAIKNLQKQLDDLRLQVHGVPTTVPR